MSDQLISKPAGVHLILADPWSKEWGQPQISTFQVHRSKPPPKVVVVDSGASEDLAQVGVWEFIGVGCLSASVFLLGNLKPAADARVHGAPRLGEDGTVEPIP